MPNCVECFRKVKSIYESIWIGFQEMGYGGEYMYECCGSGTSRSKGKLFFNPSQVRLNYKIKLNRTKSGATYMAQTLKGVKRERWRWRL